MAVRNTFEELTDNMNPLLIVTTSHGSVGPACRRTGVWLEEFVGVYCRFVEHGIPVVVASPRGGEVPLEPESLRVSAMSPEARRFIARRDPALSRTLALRSICHHDFDAIFYPGGTGPMWDLAEDLINARILGSFFDCGKVVGALCHGTAALLKARRRDGNPVIHNRRLTGCSDAEELHNGTRGLVPFSLEQRLRAAGGKYSRRDPWTRYVVIDRNLVTGQNPQSTKHVAEAMLELMRPAQLMCRRTAWSPGGIGECRSSAD